MSMPLPHELAPLLPTREARTRLLEQASSWVSETLEHLPDLPIGPTLNHEDRREWLRGFEFVEAVPLPHLLQTVADHLIKGTLLSQHPRCFGLFNPTPAFPGVLADLLTATVNPQLAVTSHAPIAVEIEKHVIDAVAIRVGWDTALGHFTSGGAEANMTAALLALTDAHPQFSEVGARAFPSPPTIYTSAESHFAWFKIAHQLGIGREAVRLVPTSGAGRMDADALRRLIAGDSDKNPVMVVATAGTTNAGMIDPLSEIAQVCRERSLWLHVDAAWAGALLASERHRSELVGMEQADSLTIDAHKWFSVPMGAGMFFTRRGETLSNAFRVAASYMPEGDTEADPYTHSTQWSRRFIGLKLFMTLAALGWNGYGQMIDRCLVLADALRQRLLDAGWAIANDSPAGVICFTDAGGTRAGAIVGALQERGTTWLSLARLEGEEVLRACITSFRATEEDLEVLVSELAEARATANRG